MRKIFAWVLDLNNYSWLLFPVVFICSNGIWLQLWRTVFQWNWCTVEASTKTGEYLDACNLLFEQGLHSHRQVNNKDSSVLEQWCANHEDTGNLLAECSREVLNVRNNHNVFFKFHFLVYQENTKRARQKTFLAWQVWKNILYMGKYMLSICFFIAWELFIMLFNGLVILSSVAQNNTVCRVGLMLLSCRHCSTQSVLSLTNQCIPLIIMTFLCTT